VKRVVVAALMLALVAGIGSQHAAGATSQPNIVVIQTDDQTYSDIFATTTGSANGAPLMPKTRSLIGGRGVTFTHYYSTYPLSCPSRTTLLTGEYAHNHRVLANKLPFGNTTIFCSYPGLVNHKEAMPARLQDSGYRTIHVGRFLNGYPGGSARGEPINDVPAGWTEWHTPVSANPGHDAALYYGYTMNDNGAISSPIGDATYRQRNPAYYFTDVITQRAIDSIDDSDPNKPFFLEFDHRAPHEDVRGPAGPQPSPAYDHSLGSDRLPRPPSLREIDTSDKPRYVRAHGPPTKKQLKAIAFRNERRQESLRSVDDSVGKLIGALDARGLLDNTYIFFFSYNGFFRGEHGFLKGKVRNYEPATHVPLVVSGPGLPHGAVSAEPVANVDIAATIFDISGATPSPALPLDGRSLLPFAEHPALRSARPILLEQYTRPKGRLKLAGRARLGHPQEPDYQAIIYDRYKFVRYADGERELYDLVRDPDEMRSLHRAPAYHRVERFMGLELNLLRACDGAACRRNLVLYPPRPGGGKKKK
jgi:N-acetylglucosamine-6-sulfatase